MIYRTFLLAILFSHSSAALSLGPRKTTEVISECHKYFATRIDGTSDWYIRRYGYDDGKGWYLLNRGGISKIAAGGQRALWLKKRDRNLTAIPQKAATCLEVWGPLGLIKSYSYADLAIFPTTFCHRPTTISNTKSWFYCCTDHGASFSIFTWDSGLSQRIEFRYADGEIIKRQSIDQWVNEPIAPMPSTDCPRGKSYLKVEHLLGSLPILNEQAAEAAYEQAKYEVVGLNFKPDEWSARANVLWFSEARENDRNIAEQLFQQAKRGINAKDPEIQRIALLEFGFSILARYEKSIRHPENQNQKTHRRIRLLSDLYQIALEGAPHPEVRRMFVKLIHWMHAP